MEENKNNLSAAQNEKTDTVTRADALTEDVDVLEQMRRYLADSPEEMAREAEEYMAEHPDTPEAAAARKARFFARLEEEKAKAAGEETATVVSRAITDPLPEEMETEMPDNGETEMPDNMPDGLAGEAASSASHAAPAARVPFYRRRSSKILAAVAACLVVLIAVPMVSQSARTAMQSMFINIFGSGASGFTYDKTTMQPYSEEELAWNEIAEKLGTERMGFDERPDGLIYNKSEINEKIFSARVFYSQNDQMISIDVQKIISTDMNSDGVDLDSEPVGEVEVPLIGQMVTVWKWEAEGKTKLCASIPHNNTAYTIYYYDDLDAMKEFVSHIYFY